MNYNKRLMEKNDSLIVENDEKCVVCSKKSVYLYGDEPSCGSVKCDLTIQSCIDYRNERDW
jgi:hypothetical protein